MANTPEIVDILRSTNTRPNKRKNLTTTIVRIIYGIRCPATSEPTAALTVRAAPAAYSSG